MSNDLCSSAFNFYLILIQALLYLENKENRTNLIYVKLCVLVALNYGIFRRKDFNESAQYIMFYDMGATSTTATIVSYQMVKTKEKGYVETNPQLSIIGVG